MPIKKKHQHFIAAEFYIYIKFLLILNLSFILFGCSPNDNTHPNVILIITDDQGYGDMSCHGHPILQTPNIDRLSREGVRLTDFHVDPYCAPTRAALMTEKIDERVKKERSQLMLKLAYESARRFRERFTGHTMMVLWEQEVQEGTWVGLTDNYIRVVARSDDPLRNSLVPASLGYEHYHCLGANIAK